RSVVATPSSVVRTRNARGPHSMRHKFSAMETIRVMLPQPMGRTRAAACPALALAALALAAFALAALAAFAALAPRPALTAFACVTKLLCRIGSYKEVLGELATVWHPASTTPVNIRAAVGVRRCIDRFSDVGSRGVTTARFSCFPISCAAPCEYKGLFRSQS